METAGKMLAIRKRRQPPSQGQAVALMSPKKLKITHDDNIEVPYLPQEMMEAIFKHSDPSTFITILNMSCAWSDLMKFHKVRILIPKVFPFIAPYLKSTDILNLRKVSTVFKDTIDFFLQYGPLHRISDEAGSNEMMMLRNIHPGMEVFQVTTIRFYSCQDIQRFLLETPVIHREDYNPFPSRSIHFAPATLNATVDDLRAFEALVKELIVKYGTHVWRLTYKMPLFCTNRWLYHHMAGLLRHLQNLRSLILNEGLHWLWGGLGDIEDEEEAESYRAVTFPPLPNLLELRMPMPKESVFHGTLITILRNLYGSRVRNLTLVPPFHVRDLNLDFEAV